MDSTPNNSVHQIFQRPAIVETLFDIAICLVPVWLAVIAGLMVGWAWKPKWATLVFMALRTKPQLLFWSTPGFGAHRAWVAFTALTGFPLLRKLWSNCKAWKSKDEQIPEAIGEQASEECVTHPGQEQTAVTVEDLEHFCHLLEGKDGGPAWQQMMDRSTPAMSYQAWRRDPEIGPPQYRSRTVFEDVTPELMRDFFWDDEFRLKWDDMHVYSKTLEECPRTGTMIVQWIRKFPFFCSDREYVIGRRIWESARTYLCLTKGIPYPSLPRHSKPRRVDLYYSSWCIRSVESRKGDGQLTACEVVLFHHEDMGIPWEIAKFGVRQGMWGAVKKLEPGVRAYQMARKSEAPLSRSAFMAQINTKIPAEYARTLGLSSSGTEERQDLLQTSQGNGWKLLIVGGAIVLACGLNRGILSKVLMFGVARRLGKFGKRL